MNLDADVPLSSRGELMDILKSFECSFANGVPLRRADAEPMHIRLRDPHKTVNRRPYLLSPQERQVVRDMVKELLDSNIIRSSSSPSFLSKRRMVRTECAWIIAS